MDHALPQPLPSKSGDINIFTSNRLLSAPPIYNLLRCLRQHCASPPLMLSLEASNDIMTSLHVVPALLSIYCSYHTSEGAGKLHVSASHFSDKAKHGSRGSSNENDGGGDDIDDDDTLEKETEHNEQDHTHHQVHHSVHRATVTTAKEWPVLMRNHVRHYTILALWIDEMDHNQPEPFTYRHCHVITIVRLHNDCWNVYQRYDRYYHDICVLTLDAHGIDQLIDDVFEMMHDTTGLTVRRLWQYWFKVDDGAVTYPGRFRCIVWHGKPDTDNHIVTSQYRRMCKYFAVDPPYHYYLTDSVDPTPH